jgi:hypothetical protein
MKNKAFFQNKPSVSARLLVPTMESNQTQPSIESGKLTTATALAVTATLTLLTTVHLWAAEEHHHEATRAGSAQMDAGPAMIDVSAYPKAGQDSYPLFTEKCAQCHHLNHTINSDHHALPDEWESIVNRMRRKPGSDINKKEAEQIIEFLTYDSSVRKKAVVDEMLAMATPKEKKAAEDKIKEVYAKYGQHLPIAVEPISQRRFQPNANSEHEGMKDMGENPAGDHKEHPVEQK